MVHPHDDNLHSYGHEIRNLLLLACTEVETHWRAVLEANGYSNGITSTKDYVKLYGPLQLESYQVSFPGYPWLHPMRPFAHWDGNNPTKSLVWYAAYNGVKHDREKNFRDAKLAYAFQAVTACAVMLCAQFGNRAFALNQISQHVEFTEVPEWNLSDIYIPPLYKGGSWKPVNYEFR
jgi:hypothetical protein